MAFPSDLEIASAAQLRPLTDVAADAGIPPECLEPYGLGAAKVDLSAIHQMSERPRAAYVVVTAITPTPLGEERRLPPSDWVRRSSTSGARPP